MAIDATGTPTSLGIPKYDTAVDNPSGNGFNAAMDAINNLLGWAKVRKNSGGSIFSQARLNFIEGAGVTLTIAQDDTDDEVDITITSSSVSGYGTALPGSPTDGQEYVLVDSTSSPTYSWRFRYNAGSSHSDKWEFIGGAPLTSVLATSNNTSSASYVAPTNAQSVTLPCAGEYQVTIGAQGIQAGTDDGYISFAIGAAAALDAHAAHWRAGAGQGATNSMISRITAAASDVLAMRVKTSAGTFTFQDRYISVLPIRVS